MEVLSVTGAPLISTTVHRGGGASLRSNPTAATAFVEQQLDASGVNGRSYHRLYLRVATLPSATTTVYAVGQSGYFPVALQLTTTGTLRLRDALLSTDVGAASGALATGVWYRIELDVSESGATGTTRAVIAALDGVAFSGTALISGSTGYSRVRAGAQVATTADVYIDDIAVNNTTGSTQAGLPGPGTVVHLHPAGAGDANGWATAVGGTAGAGNNYTRVSETTPDDATSYNQTTATGTTTIDDYTVTSPTTAGIGAADTINVVHVGGRVGSDAATAASIAYRLKSQSGGTVAESASVSVAIAGWRTHKAAMPYIPQITSYTDPQTGTAWTRARLATAQIGVRGDVSQTTARRVSALWATVDFQPRTVVALGAAEETSTGTALTTELPGQTIQVGAAAESAGGRAAARAKRAVAGALREPEAALPLAVSRTVRLGPASEQASGQAIGHARTVQLGPAADGSSARPVGAAKHTALGPAPAGEAARAMATAKRAAVSAARGAEYAASPVTSGSVDLQAAATAESARPVAVSKSRTLGAAGERGAALPLGTAKAKGTQAARAASAGQPVTAVKRLVLGVAREASAARPVAVQVAGGLGTAPTAEAGRPFASVKHVLLGAARAAEAARPARVGRTRALGTARSSSTAGGMASVKRIALGTAQAAERGCLLTASGRTHLGPARERDVAWRVRQPFQTRLLCAAREHEAARRLGAVRQRPADQLTPSVSGPVLAPGTRGPALVATTTEPRLTASSTTGG